MKYAFTLDDLPLWPMSYPPAGYSVESVVDSIISALAANKIDGVFAFSNTWAIVKHPEFRPIMDKWLDASHHVANHTHGHIELNDNSTQAYVEDIDLGESHLLPWISKAPQRYFRHPLCYWGDTDEKMKAVARHLENKGYETAEATSWLYEWRWNRAYLNCLDKGDAGVEFVRRTFLEFSLAQLRYDDGCAREWFGRDIVGITVLHPVPFFADIANDFLARLIQNGIEFVDLDEALRDPAYSQVASVPTPEFLVYQQKLAHAAGKPFPMVDPEWVRTFTEITRMAAGREG